MLKWIVYAQSMGRLIKCGIIWADTTKDAKRIAKNLWNYGQLVVLQDDSQVKVQ